jgi:hypothetical protein
MGIIITILIVALILGLIYWLITLIPSPPFPAIVKTILLVGIIILAIIYLLGMLLGYGGFHPVRI